VEELIRLSGDERQGVAEGAIYALARLAGPTDRLGFAARRRARSRLVELAASRSSVARRLVAEGLSIPVGTGEADALIALTEDPDARVRLSALSSLSFPGAPIDTHLTMLDDSDGRVVLAALLGLARTRGQEVVDTLVQVILRDDRPWLRERAVAGLRSVDPDQAAGLANGLSRAAEPRVREAAAGLLVGRSDERSIEYATRLIADEVASVRRAAIPAMAGAPGPLAEVLGDLIDANGSADRAAIARAAGLRLADDERNEAEREEAFRILHGLLEAAGSPADVEVLGAVMDAAARGGADPRTREILESGLACSDRRIRVEAIAHLRAVFDEDRSGAAGPAADLPLEHYLEIARWAKRPRAAIVTMVRPGFVPGRFTLRLNTGGAPLTAWNFVRLAELGYFNGWRVRRLVPGDLVQFGEAYGEERTDPGQAIRDEMLPQWYGPGTLAMVSSGRDRAEAEWLVTLTAQPRLLGRHTPFGRIVQNFPGVVSLLLPDDTVISIEIYEGNGREPLPPLETRPR
jgi:cyclophilin family peptidyl-prolyl cis-trans isomerase/HEAT repeat protein